MPVVRGRCSAGLLPCINACVPLPFGEGVPCHSAFFCGLCAVEPFLSSPPATPAVRGTFLMGGLRCCRAAFSSTATLRVFLAP